MANDTSVSFKASLDLGEKTEVRRFVLDHQTVTSFESLESKLRIIFPTLRNKTFSITWKDNDNDFVIISSDDELIISLFEMRDDPRRLYITVTGRLSSRGDAQGDATTHEGVVCDACDGPVHGYRYKCVQCPDFDLCATCEGHGNHPEHVMMRIPYPLALNLSRRMSHHLEKKISRCVEKMEKLEKGRYDGQCSSPRKGKRGHKNRESDAPQPEDGFIRSIIDTVLNVRETSRDECLDENLLDKNKCKSKKRSSGCPFVVQFADCTAPSTTEQAAQGHTESSKGPEQRNSHDNLLRTIGQVIASVLDPLGIDVDVDVRTKSTSEQNAKAEAAGQTAEHSPTAQATGETTEAHVVPHGDEIKQSTPIDVLTNTMETEQVMDTTEQGAESEWTLVDDSMDEGATVDVNVASSSASSSIGSPNKTENTNNEANGGAPPVIRKEISGTVDETAQVFKAMHEARLKANQTRSEFVSTTHKPVPHPEGFTPSSPFFFPQSSEINFHHMAEELHKYLNSNMVSAAENAKSTASNIGKAATSAASNIGNATTSNASNISSAATDAANIAATTAANIAAGAASAAANAFGLLYPNLTTVNMGAKPSPFVSGNVYTDITVETSTPATTQSSTPTTVKSQPAHIGKQTGAINKQSTSPRHTQSSSVPVARTPVPTAPTQQAVHPDPRIAQALNVMMAMGFTNEGGWLSTVLEQAGGDVNKAIDLLQPVGKK